MEVRVGELHMPRSYDRCQDKVLQCGEVKEKRVLSR